VGSPDDQNEHLNSAEPNGAAGSDLLYGWLVGRAAADLGLAQALAVSESRRNDQFKRLEANLLAQVRELHQNQSGHAVSAEQLAAFDALKAQIERIDARQHDLEAGQISGESLETMVQARLREFETQIEQQHAQDRGSRLGDVKFELTLLADRIARAEFFTQQAQASAADEKTRIDERIADLVKQQSAALKAQILDELRGELTLAPGTENVEALLRKRVDELRDEMRQPHAGSAYIDKLQTELAALARRLAEVEAAPDAAAVLAQSQQRWRTESEQQVNLRLNELTEVVDAKLRDLDDGASNERNSQAAALATCFERLARLEDSTRVGTADLKAEICALKTRLEEPAHKLASAEQSIARIDQSVSARIGDLQDQLRLARRANESRDAEVNGQLTTLAETLSHLAAQADQQSDQESDLKQWQRQIERSLSARAHELENLLTRERERNEQRELETNQLKNDLSSALDRLVRIELATEQAHARSSEETQRATQSVHELKAEFAALKNDLTRQSEQQLQASAQALQTNFDSKFDALQTGLAAGQQDQRSGQALLNDFRSQFSLISQRLIETESNSQRTHALLVNEGEQTMQLYNSLLAQLAELQNQLAARQARDGQVESVIGELNARFEEIHGRLNENWTHATNRDGEIAELKSQMQNIQQQLAAKGAAASPANGLLSPSLATAGLANVKATLDAMPVLTPAVEVGTRAPLMQSYVANGDAVKDPKKQLQQRMSADIERVRAELRKRAGVSR
jgi:hypothetical protein